MGDLDVLKIECMTEIVATPLCDILYLLHADGFKNMQYFVHYFLQV